MSKHNIKKLFDEVNDLLMDLAIVSTEKGIHLDNDLESAVLHLLLNENFNEMTLLKHRIETAIKKIKDGTFKIKDIENIKHSKAA